jgi:transcriptional regulator with XRE-family HTH domain
MDDVGNWHEATVIAGLWRFSDARWGCARRDEHTVFAHAGGQGELAYFDCVSAGRGPYSNAEGAALIQKITGEPVSHTTIWKLRNGQATNPQKRLIDAMARTFGVPSAFFFGGHDEHQAGLVQEEAEMLAMIRDARITADQLRPCLRLRPQERQLIVDFFTVVAQDEARRRAGQGEDA